MQVNIQERSLTRLILAPGPKVWKQITKAYVVWGAAVSSSSLINLTH